MYVTLGHIACYTGSQISSKVFRQLIHSLRDLLFITPLLKNGPTMAYNAVQLQWVQSASEAHCNGTSAGIDCKCLSVLSVALGSNSMN